MRVDDTVLRFGPNELNLRSYELRRANRRVPLSGIPLELLILLLEQPGALMRRDQIAVRLWSNPESVDTDAGINNAINRIRSLLNDDPSQPRYIETVVGRGYRFIAKVEVETKAPEGSMDLVSDPISLDHTTAPTPAIVSVSPGADLERRPVLLTRLAVTGLTVALMITLLLNYPSWRDWLTKPAKPAAIESLAVLPILNLSGDPQQEYLADGMTDQMISDLVHFSSLRVISRTSVMQLKGVKKPLLEIAAALKVDAVVEASLLRQGNQVRMVVQLLDARSDRHLWAHTYQRNWNDIYLLSQEIAGDIGEHIAKTLSPEVAHATRHPVNPQAYDFYLRGLYFWGKRTPQGFEKSIEFYKKAIQADPNYALPYAALGVVYANMTVYGAMTPKESDRLAQEAAQRALTLDSSQSRAHATLGVVRDNYWDWTGAEKEFRLATALNEGDPIGHQYYAGFLARMGRHEEGIREIRRALELDPLSLSANAQLGTAFYFAHHYDEAIQQERNTLDMEPSFYGAAERLAITLHAKGLHQEAIAVMQEHVKPLFDLSYPMALLANFYALNGDKARARELVQTMINKPGKPWVSPNDVALACVGLMDRDAIAHWMEIAFQQQDDGLKFINVDPIYDPLRSDTHFQDVVRRMKFPPI